MTNQSIPAEVMDPFQKEKESNYRWVILTLAFFVNVLTFFDRVNLSAAAPVMMKEFGWGPAVMGVVLSAFSWTYAFAQIPGGYALDRFGLKKVYGWALIAWGLITAGTASIRNVFSLGTWRVLLGLAEAPTYPGFVKLMSLQL